MEAAGSEGSLGILRVFEQLARVALLPGDVESLVQQACVIRLHVRAWDGLVPFARAMCRRTDALAADGAVRLTSDWLFVSRVAHLQMRGRMVKRAEESLYEILAREDDSYLAHHVATILGIAALRQGDVGKAADFLKRSMSADRGLLQLYGSSPALYLALAELNRAELLPLLEAYRAEYRVGWVAANEPLP